MSSLFHLDMYVTFLLTVTTFEIAKAGVMRLYRLQQARRWKRKVSDRLLDFSRPLGEHHGYMSEPRPIPGVHIVNVPSDWSVGGNVTSDELLARARNRKGVGSNRISGGNR